MESRVPPDATATEGLTNDERASWAEVALLAFAQYTGTAFRSVAEEELSLVVIDLIADLAHWCDRYQVDFQAAIQQATKHYQTETAFEGIQLP